MQWASSIARRRGVSAFLSQAGRQPGQSLWRGIQKGNLSGDDLLQYALLLGASQAAVEQRRGDPSRPQSGHLILHERNEWGDDESEPAEDEGGDLEADGLAATGGKDRKGISAGQNRLNHPPLGRPEIGVAEVALEERSRLVQALGNDVGHGTN